MSDTIDNIDFFVRYQNKIIKIFLKSGFKYEGKVTAVCNDFLEILDFKLGCKKVIRISELDSFEEVL